MSIRVQSERRLSAKASRDLTHFRSPNASAWPKWGFCILTASNCEAIRVSATDALLIRRLAR